MNSNVLWSNFVKHIIKIGFKDYKSPLFNKGCKICIGKRKKRDKSLKSHHEMMGIGRKMVGKFEVSLNRSGKRNVYSQFKVPQKKLFRKSEKDRLKKRFSCGMKYWGVP